MQPTHHTNRAYLQQAQQQAYPQQAQQQAYPENAFLNFFGVKQPSPSSPQSQKYVFLGRVNELFDKSREYFIPADVSSMHQLCTLLSSHDFSFTNLQGLVDKIQQTADVLQAFRPSSLPQHLVSPKIVQKIENPSDTIPLDSLMSLLETHGSGVKDLDLALLISVFDTLKVTDSLLKTLMSYCPQLEQLTLYENHRLTLAGLRVSLSLVPSLKRLIIVNCNGLAYEKTRSILNPTIHLAFIVPSEECVPCHAVGMRVKLSKILSFSEADRKIALSGWITTLSKYGIEFNQFFSLDEEIRDQLILFLSSLSLLHMPGSKMRLIEFAALTKPLRELICQGSRIVEETVEMGEIIRKERWSGHNVPLFCRILDMISFAELNALSPEELGTIMDINKRYIDLYDAVVPRYISCLDFDATSPRIRQLLVDNRETVIQCLQKKMPWKSICDQYMQ